MDCQPFLRLGDTPREKYNINVNLSAGVPITDLQCGSHKIDVAWDNQTSARISLSNPEEFAGNRDFILDYKLTGTEISSGLMLGTGESENFFLLMVQPPERYTPETIPPREYIFILDVSGSMYGFPLDTSKELIRNLAGSSGKPTVLMSFCFPIPLSRCHRNPYLPQRKMYKRRLPH